MSNPLWDYSLATYSLPEVAALCLRLQDEFEVDVNLLLYAAWLASKGCSLEAPHLREVDALVAAWRQDIIAPLRTLRRELKSLPGAAQASEEMKVLELNMEQQQQDMMFEFYSKGDILPGSKLLPEDEGARLRNLQLVVEFTSPQTRNWTGLVAQLSASISP